MSKMMSTVLAMARETQPKAPEGIPHDVWERSRIPGFLRAREVIAKAIMADRAARGDVEAADCPDCVNGLIANFANGEPEDCQTCHGTGRIQPAAGG